MSTLEIEGISLYNDCYLIIHCFDLIILHNLKTNPLFMLVLNYGDFILTNHHMLQFTIFNNFFVALKINNTKNKYIH